MNNPCVVLLSGKQGSGKTTLAAGVEFRLRELGCTPIRMKFADGLYAMHDQIRKILQRAGADNMEAGTIDGPLLQILGTEWGRKTRGEDIWVNIAKGRIQKDHEMRLITQSYKGGPLTYVYIFDDCRFPNEVTAFDAFATVKVRLVASEQSRKERAQKWREATGHPSEIALDGQHDRFDLVLNTEQYGKDEVLTQVTRLCCARFKP